MLYIMLVVPVLVMMIWSLLPTRTKKAVVGFDQSAAAKRPSFEWPVGVQVKHSEESVTPARRSKRGTSN